MLLYTCTSFTIFFHHRDIDLAIIEVKKAVDLESLSRGLLRFQELRFDFQSESD